MIEAFRRRKRRKKLRSSQPAWSTHALESDSVDGDNHVTPPAVATSARMSPPPVAASATMAEPPITATAHVSKDSPVGTLTPTATAMSPGAKARRTGTPTWLLKASFESVLIVISILLALAVDSWNHDAENRALARESLEIFEREIRLNAARIADAVPYHIGLRDVVEGMAAEPERVVEMQSIVEGLEPTFLLSTAWETALATGALRHIDVQTVSALSWTYSQQQRFREESRAEMPGLLVTAGMTDEERLRQIQHAHAYLANISRLEQDLHIAFLEAIRQIETTLGRRDPAADASSLTLLD